MPRRTTAHRALAGFVAGTAALGVAACSPVPFDSGGNSGGGGPLASDREPTTLVVSTAYSPDDAVAAADRLRSLDRAIDDLRAATRSGWVGRQDDVTGYLGELVGGRYPAATAPAEPEAAVVIADFLDAYGPDLFGVSATDVEPDGARALPEHESGAVTVRATQQLGGVPVLEGGLVFDLSTTDGAVLHAVGGRVYPGLDVSTTPGLGQRAARRAAVRLTGGTVQRRPALVVLPQGTGRLAWSVVVTGVDPDRGPIGLTDGTYLLDAQTGDPLDFRPGSAETRTVVSTRWSTPRQQPGVHLTASRANAQSAPGDTVEVDGRGPGGEELRANGTRVAGGVQLLDSTVPSYAASSGRGGIYTFTMGDRYEDRKPLPGDAYVERGGGTRITDPEALAAHALAREIYDYYRDVHGRLSWDGQGASLISVVNYGDNSYCNSRFDPNLAEPAMVYGNPCQDPSGAPQEVTEVEIDTAAHEITHGVTSSSAALIYAGQSGALNESFSDYFGNVIGNRYKGVDTPLLMEDACVGFTTETYFCNDYPEGFATRYMLTGNTFDDYLYLLNPPNHLALLGVSTQDNGGVHLNSSIWNNALWSIRARLAKIDGRSGNDSPLAQSFDAAVYDALTNRLGPTAGFLTARSAVEQAISARRDDPTILRVAREQFEFNKICADCSAFPAPFGDPVAVSTGTEIEPVVSGNRTGWLLRGQGPLGLATVKDGSGKPRVLADYPDTWQLAFAGAASVRLDSFYGLIRTAGGGDRLLARVDDSTYEIGLAGSEDGAAWVDESAGIVGFVDAAGKVVRTRLPKLGGQQVTALGAGGGSIAFGTNGGQLWTARPGGKFAKFGSMGELVVSVDIYGDLVAAVDRGGEAAAADTASGAVYKLSDGAAPLGVTVSASYVVWADRVGTLGGGVARSEGISAGDTDLMVFSPASGSTFPVRASRGQQGYPDLSGNRLVWQESGYGGDDVFSANLKPGL